MRSKMPISRDVRVRAPESVRIPDVPSEPEANTSKAAPELVTVMGFDRKDVLFRSNQVGCVQWRDSAGEIVAMLIRLKPDIWGFTRRGEPDWEENVRRHGNPDIT